MSGAHCWIRAIAIADYASAPSPCGLIVMADCSVAATILRHALTGQRRGAPRSDTAPCPVLTVRDPRASSSSWLMRSAGGRDGEADKAAAAPEATPSPRRLYRDLDPDPPAQVAVLVTRCAIDRRSDPSVPSGPAGLEFLLDAMARRAHGAVRNGPHDADPIAEIDGEAVNVRSFGVRRTP